MLELIGLLMLIFGGIVALDSISESLDHGFLGKVTDWILDLIFEPWRRRTAQEKEMLEAFRHNQRRKMLRMQAIAAKGQRSLPRG